MKLLLDTHIFIWWLADDIRLTQPARQAISSDENKVAVSVVTLWEIVVKFRAGKLTVDLTEAEREIVESGFERLAIGRDHLSTLADLPKHHRDPFDHLLIAQAIGEGATLISVDRAFRAYPVELLTL